MRFVLILVFTLMSTCSYSLEDTEREVDSLSKINIEHLNRPEPTEIYRHINWLENTFAVAINGLLGKTPNIDIRKSIFAEFQKIVQILETIKDKLRRAVLSREEKPSEVKEDAGEHR